jgi:hypothetical protein
MSNAISKMGNISEKPGMAKKTVLKVVISIKKILSKLIL